MKYLLDTNICIYLLRHHPPGVAARFAQCRQGDVGISAITYAELVYGVICCPQASQLQNQQALARLCDRIPVVGFDADAGQAYATVRLASADKRSDALDKLIAAHAIALDITLVTNNLKDFKRYPGLKLENWLD